MTTTPNGNGNGRRFVAWLAQVPLPVWGFLIMQFAGLTIWAIRLENRVQNNEGHLQTLSHEGSVKTNVNTQRIDSAFDRMTIIERRQDEARGWINKLSVMEQRVDALTTRTDRIVQLLDTMYSTQQEILRRLDNGPPRKSPP